MSEFTVPELPGTDIRFRGARTIRPTASIADTVAIPFTHDWGPMGADEGGISLSQSYAEWEGLYGDGDTDGKDAVLGAFVGPGIEGQAGAGAVASYRMDSGDAARASKDLTNGTNANALVLTALYKGTRGNNISVVVEADPANPSTHHRIRILFNGATVEKYVYAKTDITAVQDAINARPSKYVTAVKNTTGTALTLNGGAALTGGDDGEDVDGTNVLTALEGLEYEPFTILAPANIDDDTVQGSIVSWADEMAEANRPVMVVIGGPVDETIDEAITRTDYDSAHVISLGGGNFTDDFLDKEVSTAQLAPRVAGVLASRGQRSSILFARLGGLHFVGTNGVPTDQLQAAEEAGVTVFTRTESLDADLMIAAGVTSYTSDTTDVPKEIFGDPRLVRIIDLFIRRMRLWGNENIVGLTTVTDETRAAVRGQGKGEIASLIDQGLILNSSDPAEAPYFRADANDDPALERAIPFEFGWKFAKTTRNLVGNGTVR